MKKWPFSQSGLPCGNYFFPCTPLTCETRKHRVVRAMSARLIKIYGDHDALFGRTIMRAFAKSVHISYLTLSTHRLYAPSMRALSPSNQPAVPATEVSGDFEVFTEFAKRLVRVPRAEIQEQLEEEKRVNAKTSSRAPASRSKRSASRKSS